MEVKLFAHVNPSCISLSANQPQKGVLSHSSLFQDSSRKISAWSLSIFYDAVWTLLTRRTCGIPKFVWKNLGFWFFLVKIFSDGYRSTADNEESALGRSGNIRSFSVTSQTRLLLNLQHHIWQKELCLNDQTSRTRSRNEFYERAGRRLPRVCFCPQS